MRGCRELSTSLHYFGIIAGLEEGRRGEKGEKRMEE